VDADQLWQRLSGRVAKYDPDQPRESDGKWTSGGGGGVTDEHRARAAESLKDRAFVTQHGPRLDVAIYAAQSKFPDTFGPEGRHGDAAHEAGIKGAHEEAARIHAENDAARGSAEANEAADMARAYSRRFENGDLAAQHEAAMAAIARHHADQQRQADDKVRFAAAEHAGAVPAAPAAADEHEAVIAGHDAQIAAMHQGLQSAHEQAVQSLAELHGLTSDDNRDDLPSHSELAEHYLGVDNALSGKDEGSERYDEIADRAHESEHPEPHEDLNIDEETGKVESWTPEHFLDSDAGDRFHQEGGGELHFDADTADVIPFHELEPADGVSHEEFEASRSDYESASREYEQALAADKASYEHHVAAYAAAQEHHQAAAAAKALEAQSHLEALHEKQIAALQSLKQIDRVEAKSRAAAEKKLPDEDEISEHVINMPAFDDKEFDEDEGVFTDEATEKLHSDARDAYEAKVNEAAQRIDERRSRSGEDEQEALKDAAKATSDTVRELSKITGRAPRLGGKTKKGTMRKADWEEDKHPRDHGKFSSSEGEHGEDHEARAKEHAAVTAGHLSPAAKEIADKHVAAHQARQSKLDEHTSTLDDLHKHAAEALAALHEYSDDSHEGLTFDHSELHHAFDETQDHLDPSRTSEYREGGTQREAPVDPDEAPHLVPGYKLHPDDMPEHARPTGDAYDKAVDEHEAWKESDAHEAWHAQAKANYEAAMEPHQAEFNRRADAAQTALEKLHEHQLAAHGDLKEIDSTGSKEHDEATKALERMSPEGQVNEAAFAHHERDENGDIKDRDAAWEHAEAHEAAESMHEHATQRIKENGPHDLGAARDSLKDETKSTRDALKDLNKITGRKSAVLAKPAKPKKSNRPGSASSGSVWGMAAPARYKLRLTKLDLISLVDTPAQESAAIRLIKRKDGGNRMEATLSARLAKIGTGSDPLAYFWAFTCTSPDGSDYHDLQGDAVQPDFLKAAEDWLHTGGAMDEMHEGAANNRAAFAFPWDPEIASAMLGPEVGKLVKTSGLMIAMRPTASQLAKLRSGEFNGVSIAGTGIRELLKSSQPKCASCGTYGKADDKDCATCGKAIKRRPVTARKAVWTTADIDSLPDSSFLFVEDGKKDADGKTTPRSLRHFPYKDAAGKVDIDHLRDAIGRIPQSSLPKDKRDSIQVRAEKLLAAQHKASKRLRKQAVLTSEVDGHQHQIDLDDPADGWSDQLTTSYNTAAGADAGHTHAWVFDPATGKITIATDSGHTHTVDAVVPADVMRQAALNASGLRCPGCGEMCEAGSGFCPHCGSAMNRNDGVPTAAVDDDDSGPAVVVISARAPRSISTLRAGVSTVKGNTEEQPMTDLNELTALKAENALLKNMATLTDAQRSHYERLIAKGVRSDADAFLVLSKAQRDAVLTEIAKSDAEVYTSKSTGRVYRLSDPVEIIEAAKQSDAMAATMKSLETERSELEFSKSASAMIPNCLKGAKGNVPSRIVKALRSEFKDAAEFAEAEKALRQYEAAFAMLGKSVGYSGGDSDATDTPAKRFESAVNDFAKRNNLPYAVALEKGTASDPEIRRLYNEAQNPGSN